MHDLLSSYYPILIFMALAAFITLALLVAPFLVAPNNPDPEKTAPMSAVLMRLTMRG